MAHLPISNVPADDIVLMAGHDNEFTPDIEVERASLQSSNVQPSLVVSTKSLHFTSHCSQPKTMQTRSWVPPVTKPKRNPIWGRKCFKTSLSKAKPEVLSDRVKPASKSLCRGVARALITQMPPSDSKQACKSHARNIGISKRRLEQVCSICYTCHMHLESCAWAGVVAAGWPSGCTSWCASMSTTLRPLHLPCSHVQGSLAQVAISTDCDTLSQGLHSTLLRNPMPSHNSSNSGGLPTKLEPGLPSVPRHSPQSSASRGPRMFKPALKLAITARPETWN